MNRLFFKSGLSVLRFNMSQYTGFADITYASMELSSLFSVLSPSSHVYIKKTSQKTLKTIKIVTKKTHLNPFNHVQTNVTKTAHFPTTFQARAHWPLQGRSLCPDPGRDQPGRCDRDPRLLGHGRRGVPGVHAADRGGRGGRVRGWGGVAVGALDSAGHGGHFEG
jgi:hypothetical protein